MPKGVFNPYAPKVEKKDFHSAASLDNPFDTEFGEVPLGNVKLDGDSHVLELQNLEVADVPQRLGELVGDALKEHRNILHRHGIDILPKVGARVLEDNEVSLPTPAGYLCVVISEPNAGNTAKIEVEVFRRVACALREIPRSLLVKHKARLIVRA